MVAAFTPNDLVIGGGSSRHVLCREVKSTGSGIVAGLQVIFSLSDSGVTLAELKTGMSKFPQTMINVRLSKKVDISGNKVVNEAVAAAEEELADRGRVLLRPSGTEPLIRVLVEGETQTLVARLVAGIAKTVDPKVG